MLDEVLIPESVLRRSYAFERFGAQAAVLDASGIVVETNEAWRLFAGLNDAKPGTTGPGIDYLHVCDQADASGARWAGAVAAGLRGILRGERKSFELEYPCPSPIEDRWFRLHASTAPVHEGAGVVLFHVNVTARRLLEDRLGPDARRDPITGVPDRRAAMHCITEGLTRASLLDAPITVMNMSIDGLDAIESDLGRPAAEELLVQVTARALRVLRAEDQVRQLGGRNLVAVCGDLDEAAAAAIVQRLRDAIAAPFQLGATQVSIGMHIGVAAAEHGTTAIGLLTAATAKHGESTTRPPRALTALPLPVSDRAAAVPMQAAQAQRDAVVARSSEIVLYFEPDGTIAWASPATRNLVGIDPEALIGRNGLEMIHPDDQEAALNALGTITGLGDWARADFRVVTESGTIYWVEETVTNLVDDPQIGYIVGNLRDITERKRLELDLLEQATHDTLTGLANRRLLLTELGAVLAASDAEGAGVGILLFDVDRFKLINDSFGHDRGDHLLVAIADALRATLAPADIAARFGSDAFAIVAPDLASADQALELAHRLRARLAEGLLIGDDRYLPTISIGIVIAKPGDTPITALRDAETAMYRAKENGRDRAEWFDPALHRDVVANFEVERDLRVAIKQNELFLEFQPVLDLETNAFASCEALVRWHHPTRGRLAPDDFIPIAENTGLIVLVGRWVLRHALVTAANWPDAVRIAVNLSPRELAEPDFITFVSDTLTELHFPAERVVFEITENAVIQDPTAASRTIAALRTLGISVVIDDFGTGYTSLSFLRDYPLDGLKIDRSFITEIEHGSTAIVDAMIRMSAALGLEVIAEGIETDAELAQLRELGCRYIQGFLVSRPVAPEHLAFARQ